MLTGKMLWNTHNMIFRSLSKGGNRPRAIARFVPPEMFSQAKHGKR